MSILGAMLVLTAGTSASAAVLTGGNGIYVISVDDAAGFSCGTWTAVTGAMHPAGAGLNVLYGAGTPGTSKTTLRSYDTGTDYATGSPPCTGLCSVAVPTITPLLKDATTVGYEMSWVIADGGNTINFTQTVIVEGPVDGTETVDNTVIRETHTIENLGPGTFSYGVRKHWDWQVGSNDGPWFGDCLSPATACDTSMNLTAGVPPVYPASYTINEDPLVSGCPAPVAPQNGAGCAGTPIYLVAATVTPPSSLVPPPDAPELLQFNSWPALTSTCWEPALSNNAFCGGGDTAAAYFYGLTAGTALTLDPDEQRSLTQYVLAAQDECPDIIEECGNENIDEGEDCDPPASQGGLPNCGDNCLFTSLCGNDALDPPDEECDGTDDAACPDHCGIPGAGADIECVCSPCGCMDIALVVDDTGSMGGAIANVKTGLTDIITAAQTASGGDLRMSLVTFSDMVEVDQAMTSVIGDVQTAVNALVAGGGNNFPEASDQALRTVVTDTSACGPAGAHGAFREECVKVAVLVTDADPGGCDDLYTVGVDDVEANAVAGLAAAAGIQIAAVRVGGAADATILQNYAGVTGGAYAEVPSDGTGTSAVIEAVIEGCGGQTTCGNDVIDLRCTGGANEKIGFPCAADADCDSQNGGDGVCEPEECDGVDDAACPGRCRPMGDPNGDCTCRICGDGILDPGEQCDNGMGVEVCTMGSGDEDTDGLLNCDDIEDCPAICDTQVACMVDADCPPSQNNGKWTFFPDSKCVDGQCWVYCAQDIFCRNNPSIPGSNFQSACVSAQTCDANCQFEEVCQKLGRDPAVIRMNDGKPDYFKIHASFPVSEDTDPEADGFRLSLYNADGSIYETFMLAGDLVGRKGGASDADEKAALANGQPTPTARSFKYKNKAARSGDQQTRGGVFLLDLRKRQRDGQTVMTFRLKAYGDLSNATKALMTTQVAIGGEGASLQSLWRKTSNGWKLKQSDLF